MYLYMCVYLHMPGRVVQCIAVSCSVLQCVAVFLHCVAVCCSMLQRVPLCRNVLQCVALSYSVMQFVANVLQYVAVCCSELQCMAVCCSVLQCVAVCYSVLQCAAVCCSVLQCVAVCCRADLRKGLPNPGQTSEEVCRTRCRADLRRGLAIQRVLQWTGADTRCITTLDTRWITRSFSYGQCFFSHTESRADCHIESRASGALSNEQTLST